jgi:xyloglucan-specific exo-beta-1,4-glucanase
VIDLGSNIHLTFRAQWDTTHNVSISSLADGIEETSVQGLISPPTGAVEAFYLSSLPTKFCAGANLISALGDIQGFVHTDLTKPPAASWTNPKWKTTADMDFAGNNPLSIVRVGTGDSYAKLIDTLMLVSSCL